MASRYLMQIVDRKTGIVVQFEPGLKAETDFVTDCVAHVVSRGVGIGRTSAQVAVAVQAGVEDALMALKGKITP
jgi:hypothetical protein